MADAIELADDPPGALEVIAVLIGQRDGKVFIPDEAIRAVERMRVVVWRDEVRSGYVVELRPPDQEV